MKHYGGDAGTAPRREEEEKEREREKKKREEKKKWRNSRWEMAYVGIRYLALGGWWIGWLDKPPRAGAT